MKTKSEYGERFHKQWKKRLVSMTCSKKEAQYWYRIGWTQKQSFDDSRKAKKDEK